MREKRKQNRDGYRRIRYNNSSLPVNFYLELFVNKQVQERLYKKGPMEIGPVTKTNCL